MVASGKVTKYVVLHQYEQCIWYIGYNDTTSKIFFLSWLYINSQTSGECIANKI